MDTVVEKAKMADERKKKSLGCALFEARGDNLCVTDTTLVTAFKGSLPKKCRWEGQEAIQNV